jgi:hypothetical protein
MSENFGCGCLYKTIDDSEVGLEKTTLIHITACLDINFIGV